MLSTQLAQYTACWDQGRATEKHNLPLILIHGLGLDHHCFNGMVPAIAQTHRVITFDLAGHGETPCVDDERPSLDLFARQTLEVMNRLGIDQAVLIGFSLGGMIKSLKAFHQSLYFSDTLIYSFLLFAQLADFFHEKTDNFVLPPSGR